MLHGNDLFQERIYLVMFPAVGIGALLGGFWPGMLATTAATAAIWYFEIEPERSFRLQDLGDTWGLLIFFLSGWMLSLIGGRYRAWVERGRREQKRLQDRLEVTEDLYVTLFREAPAAICLVGLSEGKVVNVNKEFVRLFGRSDLQIEFTEPHVTEKLRRIVESGESVRNLDCMFVEKHDGVRSLVVSTDRILAGKSEFLLVVFRDITEQRRRESAEESSRMKELFLATLSHELRTPLTAILAWAQLLQRKYGDVEGIEKGLRAIEVGARAQEQLISDLLDISRINSGKMAVDLQEVDLGEIVDATAEILRPQAMERNLALEVNRPQGPVVVRCDRARMGQVISNLLSNALKFTPKWGHVRVNLETQGERAVIRVSDSGRGFDPSMAHAIFERFAQGDASTTRQFGGLGLGLSLVQGFMSLQGGSARGESAGPGMGATFTVELPLQSRASKPLAKEGSPQAVSLKGVRVLLVEDEVGTGDALSQLLSNLGADVCLARSAQEALQRVDGFGPHVLVSDIAMPEQDGYSLVKGLRQSLGPQALPAIAITAFGGTETRDRALAAGFCEFQSKPLDVDALGRKILALKGSAAA
jgi:PAS domain S-box-containing protein